MFLLRGTIIAQLLAVALCYKSYQDKIPNGVRVPHPCLTNHIWKGVGHQHSLGGGTRNPFGLDFASNGNKWDATLCNKDSDGDGKTNGEELGDPNCVWTEGSSPSTLNGLSHPGVCEPLNATNCQAVNTWDFCTKEEFTCGHLNSPDVKNITLRFTQSTVPPTETNYYCQVFDIPHDAFYHLIATQPALDNENVIHHMILTGCADDPSNTLAVYSTPQPCGMAAGLCSSGLGGWTVGQVGSCPNNTQAGIKFGGTLFKKAMLQVHWNNPLKVSGYKDASGLTLYYTPNLRQYDMSTLVIGNTDFRIPPGKLSYAEGAGCTSACTEKNLVQPIKITSALLHMHYLGVSGELKHYRNGQLITTLASEPGYSYDNPITHEFNPVVEFLPGDELNMTCTFKSSGIGSATYYGEGTQEEMCFGFLNYYPPSDLFACSNIGSINFCTGRNDTAQAINVIEGCHFGAYNNTEQNAAFETLYDVCDESGSTCTSGCFEHMTEKPHPCLTGDAKKLMEGVIPLIGKSGLEIKAMMRSCDNQIYDGAPISEAPMLAPLFWIQASIVVLIPLLI